MRRLLSLVVMLAVVIGLVGWSRGWWTVAKVNDDQWTVTVNKDKLHQDEQTAKAKLGQVEGDLKKDATSTK